MNIYSVGNDGEFTIHMVKNSCEEFQTLTYDQAMKVCELLAKYAHSEDTSYENLQSEIYQLEEELSDREDEISSLESRLWQANERNKKLEQELEELKNASNN